MIKRNTGRLLLSLLVITGLAGTIHSSTISFRERRSATTLLKESRTGILEATEGLSPEQLNFRSSKDTRSIRECILQAATDEHQLWEKLQNALKHQADPKMRRYVTISDGALLQRAASGNFPTTVLPPGMLYEYNSVDAARIAFRKERTAHLKYMRTTTEDLRNHVVQTVSGWIDCYQLCLLIASNSEHLEQEILSLRANPAFPH